MEGRLRKYMEQNQEYAKTSSDPAEIYEILKVVNEQLQWKIQELQARFRAQEESFVIENIHVVYNMRRKTLEDVKIGIKNIDDYIAEARTLETTSFENIPARTLPQVLQKFAPHLPSLKMKMKVLGLSLMMKKYMGDLLLQKIRFRMMLQPLRPPNLMTSADEAD